MVVKLAPQISFTVLLLFHLAAAAFPISKPGCTYRCGNITIPYPFGIGRGCYMDEWFEVTCDQSVNPPVANIKNIDMELLNISVETGTARIKTGLASISNCFSSPQLSAIFNLTRSPFVLSSDNKFIAMGCNVNALLSDSRHQLVGCELSCTSTNKTDGSMKQPNNIGSNTSHCQVSIPSLMQYFKASLENAGGYRRGIDIGCNIALLVDETYWSSSNIKDPYTAIESMEYVQLVLNWKTNDMSRIKTMQCSKFNNATIFTQCVCGDGTEGNPYFGCTDIDECERQLYKCGPGTYCENLFGSYDCKEKDTWKLILGACLGFGLLFLVAATWMLYKAIKNRNIRKFKEKNFKRNGGLLLQQQLHSKDQGNVNKTKLFNSNELEMATDNFNVSRILGQGGQGTVYKGMLADGKIVAVKKSKIVDEGKLEEFINEVVILSQINHRNVVKLLGCCLETQVPLLVYEFIPNGTLFQYLHNKNDELPLTWEMRLRIATEVAGALSYLHSSASIPIYHRDVKSTNILLDEKNRAKVADFGTSRSIAIDQTHLTTHVQGTFGYLDPEYFQSSQFTEKSDVYSFGVVLVELITGLKPIFARESEEGRSLATYFLLTMESNRVLDIVDGFLQEHSKCIPEIMAVADLAKRCLNLNGRMRPTMREVTRELDAIPFSEIDGNATRKLEEVEKPEVTEITDVWDVTTFTSTGPIFESGTEFSSIDIEPLISSKKL